MTSVVVALITGLVTIIGFMVKDRFSLIKPLRDEILALRADVKEVNENLDKAIEHIDALRSYIHDKIPDADPPKTPAFLRR